MSSRADMLILEGWRAEGQTLELTYKIDSHTFVERFTFPADFDLSQAAPRLSQLYDLLLTLAGVSYYKAFLPPVVKGIPEVFAKIARGVYYDGLAEFFFTNRLDPQLPEFAFRPVVDRRVEHDSYVPRTPGAFVAVGGGKDSVVSLEVLRSSGWPVVAFTINPTRYTRRTIEVAQVDAIFVERKIDKQLLELNQKGALNGHIPVTAINSVAALIAAASYGYRDVVFSNEGSASVPTGTWRGIDVNHQYSKGIDFERLLQRALAATMGPELRYYSLIRRFSEVRVCQLFANYPQYFNEICSCNRAYTIEKRGLATPPSWCCECEKCAFVFLALAPAMDRQTLIGMFGRNMLADETLTPTFARLLGIGPDFALECVGTSDEARWCMKQLSGMAAWSGDAVVKELGRTDLLTHAVDPIRVAYPDAVPSDAAALLDHLS
ncbi:hypothetical protein [Paractinoplanes rishiriensis]|uniref:UDP-N-acetyl-alpha-D-muramoyl-L-alanyl-L-glutamate epimerase n=1 Tax=Paractinoplanes rishiriensis TaxID=1050105 RepID=A0A919MXY5_9ACTN|nr:hypothetical protein [Actinoplanes rishiriensis]GIE99488.1 hypothetical protein Ari01nite_69530 [Actinoplanes rishiriensis]